MEGNQKDARFQSTYWQNARRVVNRHPLQRILHEGDGFGDSAELRPLDSDGRPGSEQQAGHQRGKPPARDGGGAATAGYLPTADSVALPSRPAALEFFLPIRQNVFVGELADHIRDHASRMPLVASCKIHDLEDISPATLQAAVDNCSLETKGWA